MDVAALSRQAARLQYIGCTLLGYSLREYRQLTRAELLEQLELHKEACTPRRGSGADEDGVMF